MADIRVYFVIHADTAVAPNENQWRALITQVKSAGLANTILQTARANQNLIHAHKRSQNAGHLNRYTLAVFEVDRANSAFLLTALDAEAGKRGVTGTARSKFEAILSSEIQEAARALGYSTTQAAKISTQIIAYGDRQTSIAAAQKYLRDNATIWYESGVS